jgi:hypothetical protein
MRMKRVIYVRCVILAICSLDVQALRGSNAMERRSLLQAAALWIELWLSFDRWISFDDVSRWSAITRRLRTFVQNYSHPIATARLL